MPRFDVQQAVAVPRCLVVDVAFAAYLEGGRILARSRKDASVNVAQAGATHRSRAR